MIQTVRILCLFVLIVLSHLAHSTPSHNSANFTVLDKEHYRNIVITTRHQIQTLLAKLQQQRDRNPNAQMAFIARALADIPYSATDAIGEGDWQPRSFTYQPNALHINQNPVYRLDKLNCQSFAEIVLALLISNNLNQFDRNYLKIAYGAASNPNGEIVRYYNRNHFVDGDFNPINQQHSLLIDVTTSNQFEETQTTSALITRQQWFQFQFQHLVDNVHVLSKNNGVPMVKRFLTMYSHLDYPHFIAQNVSISYLPKQVIALPLANGGYEPNQALLDAIPTPAVAEIISNVKRWTIHGLNIKNKIGSELSVPHLGLLYRQQFRFGDLIYQKIMCHHDASHDTVCQVIPITCEKTQCNELMFAHATQSHPDGFYWYQASDGQMTCTRTRPQKQIHYSQCNRVETLPLFDYLTEYQYGYYWYMSNPAILGVHIEKISPGVRTLN